MAREPGALVLPVAAELRGRSLDATVTIGRDSIAAWLLHLCLVRCGFLPSVAVRPADGRGAALGDRLWIGPWEESDARSTLAGRERWVAPAGGPARVRWSAEGPNLWATEGALDAWIHFFLAYYRMGRSPVDHLDVIPLVDPPGTVKAFHLVLALAPDGSGPAPRSELRGGLKKRQRG